MQKQAFYKQVHVWPGKKLTTVHILQKSVSLLVSAETKTTMQQMHKCWLPYYSVDYVGMENFDLVTNSKSQLFQDKLFKGLKQRGVTKQMPKQVGDHSVGQVRRDYTEWIKELYHMNENGQCLHASSGQVSVIFHRQRERERWFLTHTQVQTSPASLVSVIDALMGVDGGGWHWTKGGQVQTWTSKGPAGRLSTNPLSSDTRGWNRWKDC